ncbi:MAG: 4-hydroxy-tetrahydrodipicolinate reductase [Dehalococcoidales bacterium]|jgi:4-hydroxy-tetrahydrodipicolinate reductase|nr:4-hydroxy-tetrahydrodipicolinate reductase [Dehalococcoidales bacterium]MDP6576659.1 4-hydroxy-tetrahydrodipicolinate reductase [Dehalococcoidales bacterium]|tara:strand:- start:280 stop:1074 length:795 start_codon:yes stop_codon:yes gene_type:complete
MEPIRVIVHGALGRVGQEVVKAICCDTGTQLVGAVDLKATGDSLILPDGSRTVPFSTDLDFILTSCRPEVTVDFTTAKATMPAVRAVAKQGVNLVIGTTGLTPDDLGDIDRLATEHKIGVVIAPNFALGAVLMMHFARIAAKYLDSAEIIELHHDQKIDAPSGTALSTAKAMTNARGRPFLRPKEPEKALESRGETVEGVTVHSVRLPGLLAHQEVLLGAPGQTLIIRHDTISRECFMPGVMLAVKEVVKRQGLTRGLDTLLGF